MIRAFCFSLALPLLCGPALGDISDPKPKDWGHALSTLRAEIGLPDIADRKTSAKGAWRFTYMLSLALDSPNVVTVEEQPDGSAKVMVTTENPSHQAYRVAEYDQQWTCSSNETDGLTISCPPLPPRPTGPQYETVQFSASPDDVARLRNLFQAAPICDEPEAPTPFGGRDGSDWLFEASDGGRYCLAHRHSPGAGNDDPNGEAFQQLGRYMALPAQGRIFPM